MCAGFNFQKAEVSFLFTTTQEIQKFHKRFFGDPSATDVITFAPEGARSILLAPSAVDIVISLDQASAQAKPRGLKLFHEVALLMCHGLLHAKGFDDLTERDWLEMRKQEFEWLARVF